MTGPALQELGLALISAHMIIFWLSQTSNVTPPIALAAFAGAGIAGAPPMRSAVEAFKLSNGLFVIPLMMAYSPLLLGGDNGWLQVLLAAGVTFALMLMLAVILEAYLFAAVDRRWRIIAAVAAALLLPPVDELRLLGLLVAAAVVGVNYRRHNHH
jgi:TRAP-type uncharacterized transport system fused permease subunit